MPAAAVVTNSTNQGGTITGPGVSTVLIGNKPAAVQLDLHSPGSSTPPGNFPIGSKTVFFGGKGALRITDTSSVGAMTLIGVGTVMIGG